MSNDIFSYALRSIPVPAGRTLWLYGEAGIASGDVYHPWHGPAQLLASQGCNVLSDIAELKETYDCVFIQAPKQREEAEGLLALALKHSKGFVMVAAANNAGGTRLQAMMERYGVPVHHVAKSHARAVWTFEAPKADTALIHSNLEHLASRQVEMEGGMWWTQPGLFGWNKIDPGSRLLIAHLPPDLQGRVADFGCGYGYIASELARQFPGIISIDAYDADARAVANCKRNNASKVNVIWQDMESFTARPLYDAIIMNPPFHSGKQEDVDLGKIFISKAWESLKPGGRLCMVANRHLGYEKTFPQLSILYQGEGYKIMTGRVA